MQQEKEKALEAIRNLVAYYISDFQEGSGYTSKQQLIYQRLLRRQLFRTLNFHDL